MLMFQLVGILKKNIFCSSDDGVNCQWYMCSLVDLCNVYSCEVRTILHNPHVFLHRIEVEDGIVVGIVFDMWGAFKCDKNDREKFGLGFLGLLFSPRTLE